MVIVLGFSPCELQRSPKVTFYSNSMHIKEDWGQDLSFKP